MTEAGNKNLELNEQFRRALELMEESGKNIFITGKAGTGKSTLLDYFRNNTRKKVVVLAPTGVAALNVCGETIHSFFGFKPDITRDKVKKISDKKTQLFKKIEAIVIDEVSMVRADLLDCVDRFLRLNGRRRNAPFGGIQILFFGDLYQLPPVVSGKEKEIFQNHYASSYFFDAEVFKEISLEFVELEKIYRQKDETFIDLLNAIRNNSITAEGLALLNQRVGANFSATDNAAYTVSLTTTNKMAAAINAEHLEKLKTEIRSYPAEVLGDFKEQSFPTDYELHLAAGSQVMLLNNDAQRRWVNGSIGEIIDIRRDKEKNGDIIFVRLSDNSVVEVRPYNWEIFHFQFNERKATIETEIIGSFTQYPIKLAWAITIHKSQGKTFDRVIIDLGRGAFAHGQTYVALSRCTSLGGIVLSRPVKKSDVFTDWRIVRFITQFQYTLSDRDLPLEKKLDLIKQAIDENRCLEIVYLKSCDEKSHRVIKPYNVGRKLYLDRPFIGVEAYCLNRKEDRTFRVDRILEMKFVSG